MTVNTAIIGCGPAARNQHLPALQLNPKANLVALCDLDTEALQKAETEGVRTYTDIEELVENEALDSVHICTPPQTRVDIAGTVMPHGIDVLFEKPLAASVSDGQRLKELAAEHDVLASVVHNKLFTPYFRKARKRVENGDVGDVVATDVIHSSDSDLTETHRDGWVNELPGGEIGEGLPHRIYMALAFCDGLGEVECVSFRNRENVDNIAFDGICIQIRDESGDQLVSVRVLTNTINREQLTVYGSDGELVVDNNLKAVRSSTFEDTTAKGIVKESVSQVIQQLRGVAENALGFATRTAYRKMDDPRGEESDSHFVLIDHYLDAVQSGGEPPVTLDEGIETVEVLEIIDRMT